MEYYILRLWDCATPSFCSFDKIYVGTEADIRKAIASMKRAGVNEETVVAVSHYLSGDKTATHNIAYSGRGHAFRLLLSKQIMRSKANVAQQKPKEPTGKLKFCLSVKSLIGHCCIS